MFCRYCGKQQTEDAVFCCSCGKNLSNNIKTQNFENQNTIQKENASNTFPKLAIVGFILPFIALFVVLILLSRIFTATITFATYGILTSLIAFPACVLGIIFAIKTLIGCKNKHARGRGLAIAGLIVSACTLIIIYILLISISNMIF